MPNMLESLRQASHTLCGVLLMLPCQPLHQCAATAPIGLRFGHPEGLVAPEVQATNSCSAAALVPCHV